MTTWIFQGNPDRFDVDGYLALASDPLWQINQESLAPEMNIGDRVFIWRSQGAARNGVAGVIASGVIVEPPKRRPDDARSLPFWTSPPSVVLRTRLRIDRVANGKKNS